MTLQRVETRDQVSLNETRYRISGPVRADLANVYPGKVVIGDTTRDSQTRLSVLARSDWRGGIGIENMEGAAEVDRAWWSTANLRHFRHLTLPPLATQTAASGVSGVFSVGAIGELSDEIYAAFGKEVYKYDNVGDSWGSKLDDLETVATDTITISLDGTTYLIFAHTSKYTYYNGSTWVTDDEDVLYMAEWDDRLWGIDNTGQLRFSLVIGTWTDDAKLPLPDGSVTDLFIGRDATGEPILFAMTTRGLWAHDVNNARFLATEFGLPEHPDNGRGSTRFRGFAAIPAGLSIYRYQDGASQAVISLIGPDRDDGVPSDRRGTIKHMVASHNELLAATDATTVSGRDVFATTGMAAHGAGALPSTGVISPAIGYSYIAGWNEVGWQVKWLSDTTENAITYMMVSNAYDKYRLWWSHDQRVYFMDLPRDIINPRQISDFKYASSAQHEDPWFDAGQAEVDKIVVRRRVEVRGTTSTETITPYYRLNYSSSWTAQSAISSDGTTTYEFPDSTTPYGTEFRAIQTRLDLSRGDDSTLAPAVISDTLEYRKKLPAQSVFTVTVDISTNYGGLTPAEQRAALVTAAASNVLVQFTYRDDSGNSRNYWVDLVSATNIESTGHDETGQVRLQLVEV